MKQKLISIIILILISSCSTNAPVPTGTLLPVSTNTPLPTELPTLIPTDTPVPTVTVTVAVDPNEVHEIGNVIYANKDLAPFPGKQLEVNPELEAVFAKKVFDLCNQYTFLTEMAAVISVRKNTTPLNDAKYLSFEKYMELVVQPAIDEGKTIEAFHLVGHATESRRAPYIGMVEALGNIDPSRCSVAINGQMDVYPNSPVIEVGSYQIGMRIIQIDGKNIRQLIINPDMIVKNNLGFFFANANSTPEETEAAYSQLIETATNDINWISINLPGSSNSTYKNQFVLGDSGSISFSTATINKVDQVKKWMATAQKYFIAHE